MKLCETCGSSSRYTENGDCPRCVAKKRSYTLKKYPQVIGIAGVAGAGKDTAADYLLKHLLLHTKASFADPIKRMLMTGLNISPDYLWGSAKETTIERLGCSSRKLMQTLGTEWGRDLIHEDIWVQLMHDKVMRGAMVIIPDIRMPNEAEYIRNKGVLIHITGRSAKTRPHQTEMGLTTATGDFNIDNSKDHYHLKEQLNELIDSGFK